MPLAYTIACRVRANPVMMRAPPVVHACREHDSRKVAWENEQKRSKKTDAQLAELKIKRDAAKAALDEAKALHVRGGGAVAISSLLRAASAGSHPTCLSASPLRRACRRRPCACARSSRRR